MKLKKISDIIKSIGAPNKDDTLLGVFNGKTAQKSIEDILNAFLSCFAIKNAQQGIILVRRSD